VHPSVPSQTVPDKKTKSVPRVPRVKSVSEEYVVTKKITFQRSNKGRTLVPFRSDIAALYGNTMCYAYDTIKNRSIKRTIPSMSFVKFKSYGLHKFVYLQSFVLASNGAQSYFDGSDHETVINLL
jgi:hypothetical protein